MNLNHMKDYNCDIRNWMLRVADFSKCLSKKALTMRSCPVCKSNNSNFFANNGSLNYEKCNACSLIFMNPTIDMEDINEGFKGEDALVMEYVQQITKYKTSIPPKPDPLVDNKLLDIYKIKRSGKLLDIGCSVGDFLHKAKYFYEVEGVEVNPYTSAIAEQYFKIHKDYLAALNLKSEYDIVTLNQVLYGVPDPVGLFEDIYKVLNDKGILYVNTPNSDSSAVKLYQGKVNHLHGYTTQNLFNKQSLNKLASITGFRIISFRTEWLDIYFTDLNEYFGNPSMFIHKRNCYVDQYEGKIACEDELQKLLNLNLENRGNYLVAVLAKV